MATENGLQRASRPLIFGEVLFDRFPDGSSVLGGAPFNVAWNLRGFGLNPLFISRVGRDVAGDKVFTHMQDWGLDTSALQRDERYPTGAVKVTLADGQPSFDICAEQAYDFISHDEIARSITDETFTLLYHGTLAGRHQVSHATLEWMATTLDSPIFVDINLRPPWNSPTKIDEALSRAHWLKLNSDELMDIAESNHSGDIIATARQVMRTFNISEIFLTLGADGAYLVTADEAMCGEPVAVGSLIDTVGAGDAFAAVSILGIQLGWSRRQLLRNALEFASAVCGIRGATCSDPSFYQEFATRWKEQT